MTESTLPTLPLRRFENTALQLLNDMRTVTEARCRLHGVGGGTTANSAAALLPCIGVEMVALRTNNAETKDQSIRVCFVRSANQLDMTDTARWASRFSNCAEMALRMASTLIDVQLANGPKGGIAVTFWIDANAQRSICVDEVGPPGDSGHLEHWNLGGEQMLLKVSAQHLYVDVKRYLEAFLTRLHSDAALQRVVAANDERLLLSATVAATEGLEEQDFIALGL